MKTVFQADSVAEARMVADLLEREGIAAEIEGEHLVGAAGGLPAMGMVKVVVAAGDATAAEAVIREQKWNESEEVEKTRMPKGANVFLIFVMGTLFGSVVAVWALKTPYDTQGLDWDQDGNYEERLSYAGETYTEIEYDRDDDGNADAIQRFDYQGLQDEYRADENFDGHYEWRTDYKLNQPVYSEADIDGDGFAEMVLRYRHGSLVEQDALDRVSRKVRATYYFCSSKAVAANVDRDGDGKFDSSVRFDYFGLEVDWSDTLFETSAKQCGELVKGR